MKDHILELDYHSPPEINLQLCIPDTTQKWLVSCTDSINILLSLIFCNSYCYIYLFYFCIGAIKSILAKGRTMGLWMPGRTLVDPTLCHHCSCMFGGFEQKASLRTPSILICRASQILNDTYITYKHLG